MTVWSLLTANEDPTSPSSHILPVEQPKQLKTFFWSHLHSLHQTALSEGRGLSHILPALSAEAVIGYNSHNLHVVFYRKEEVQEKTKINVFFLCGLWRLTMEITLPYISWLLCCILSRHPYTVMNGRKAVAQIRLLLWINLFSKGSFTSYIYKKYQPFQNRK